MLKESLANTLCDPAMDLALEQERVDSAAEIVDDGIAFNCDDAGIGIDLDLDDVATVGKGLGWRHSVTRRIEPRLHARRPPAPERANVPQALLFAFQTSCRAPFPSSRK